MYQHQTTAYYLRRYASMSTNKSMNWISFSVAEHLNRKSLLESKMFQVSTWWTKNPAMFRCHETFESFAMNFMRFREFIYTFHLIVIMKCFENICEYFFESILKWFEQIPCHKQIKIASTRILQGSFIARHDLRAQEDEEWRKKIASLEMTCL